MSLLTITKESFLNRYDKPKTRSQAHVALVAWDRFVHHLLLDEADVILQLKNNEKEKYRILDHMVQFWRNARNPKRFCQKRDPSTISIYFIYVKAWLKFNDVELSDDKIKDAVRFPRKTRERVRGVDRDMIFKMYDRANTWYKALIVFQSCTAMRIGEALNARMSWIDFESDPAKITIPGQFTKTGQERITFLTPEAVRHIREIAEGDIIFNKSYQSVWNYMNRLRTDCGFTDRGVNGQHHVRIHKFRAFAENKIARAVDSEYAHTILGHTKDLISYNQGGTSDLEYAEDFKKAIPSLTISTNHKLLDENEKLKDQANAIKEIKRQQEMMTAFMQAHPQLAEQFRRFMK